MLAPHHHLGRRYAGSSHLRWYPSAYDHDERDRLRAAGRQPPLRAALHELWKPLQEWKPLQNLAQCTGRVPLRAPKLTPLTQIIHQCVL